MEPLGLYAQLACIWEATARKPGNVHRYADFADAGYLDFLVSAAAVAPVLDAAPQYPIGHTVYEGVRRTRQVTSTNTNLGILLLLAPLARPPGRPDLRGGVANVLAGLDVADARMVYAAIRLANPGGLGRAPEQDVRDEPTLPLREVMIMAAGWDLVARQYGNDFQEVFEEGVPALRRGLDETGSLEEAIIACHLHLMSRHPDSLIARKRGPAEAEEASRRAHRVLQAGWPRGPAGWSELADLDDWLRAEGHARNPGTSADLVTACLFAALREGTIQVPPRYPWPAGFPS
jgi:triphosphoribosyl-dephospho-CoA synthase